MTDALAQLNRCRLFLQVTMLSEICNAQGSRILDQCYERPAAGFWRSKLLWPEQGNPGSKQWCLWRRALKPLLANNLGQLKSCLGEWFLPVSQLDQVWDWHLNLESGLLCNAQSGFIMDKNARASRQQKYVAYRNPCSQELTASVLSVPADVQLNADHSQATVCHVSLSVPTSPQVTWDQFLLSEVSWYTV